MVRHDTIDNIRTLEDYRYDLGTYIAQNGHYTHNLISLTLRQIAREFGVEEVKKAVKDFDLKRKYGIG